MSHHPPLRVLHTSDWHLGAVFHEQDRRADEQEALDAIIAVCRDEQVDVVVVAGDVFDTPNPAAEDQRRYYQTVLRLIGEAGVGTVVIIAGNHDSGLRLDAPRDLLEAARVVVRGMLPVDADPARCLVTALRRDGQPGAVVAAVPYLREVDLTIAMTGGDLPTRQAQAMEVRFAAIAAAARSHAATAGLPLITVAHAFARSATLGGGERAVLAEAIGNLGQIDPATLATDAAYLALGHLHRPQQVGGQAHWRYSGSLLPTGFDEIGTRRGVVLAEIRDDTPATVTVIPLAGSRRYADLRGPVTALHERIVALPQIADDAPPGFLRAVVELDEPYPGIVDQVASWAQQRGWRALIVRRQTAAAAEGGQPTATVIPDITELDPEEVFIAAYAQQHPESTPSADLLHAFRDLCRSVQEEG